AGVTTAMSSSSGCGLERLVWRVLARDARGNLDAAVLEVRPELLLVLAAEAEPVRADGRLLVADLVGQPGLIRRLVLAPHLPLAGVVLEHLLVHHRDAVLDGA